MVRETAAAKTVDIENAAQQLPGFWWLMAALIAVCSSSMILHESASWVLSYTDFFGITFHVREYSCDAHSLGLIFGYAISSSAVFGRRHWLSDAAFWVAFFAVQFVNVFAYYTLLSGIGPALAVVVVQFVGGASGALMFVACSQVAYRLTPRAFIIVTVAVIALTCGITQGLFSILEEELPLVASELTHLALIGVATFGMARSMRSGSCFRAAWDEAGFLPVAARNRDEGSEQGGEADSSPSENAPKGFERLRRLPISVRLFVIIGTYGAVFGFLHVVPLALPLQTLTRVLSYLVGAALAMVLFVVTLHQGKGSDASRIWVCVYRFVFPLVTVAALLGPLTASTEFLPALVMQGWALSYFDALLAMGCYVVCMAIHAAPYQVFSCAFLVRAVGFLVGNFIGSAVNDYSAMDVTTFSVIGAVIFVLLVLVTFNMNAEKYAKTVWGLLPHEDPRGHYERRIEERCLQLTEDYGLTEREAEVLRLLAVSKRPKEISEMLVVSVATVRSHVHAIYTKTGVHSSDELLKLVNS
ncbi:MAG: helix-turn-helix transcriptional regulator [Adlercreutzia sp.]|nr:helix-turn-helix transcriptional regulator [Adlercreutzia sp.]